jgi:hypothetical protein
MPTDHQIRDALRVSCRDIDHEQEHASLDPDLKRL